MYYLFILYFILYFKKYNIKFIDINNLNGKPKNIIMYNNIE